MQSIVPRHDKPAAIRTDLGAIFVSLELSRSTWLVTSLSPGSGERMSKHAVSGGDIAGLLRRLFELKEKARRRMRKDFPIVVIQEEGLDGFWIHRVLEQEGIESHIVDPASIMTSRRRRRAKTDRIDGEALVRALLAHQRGEPRVCAMVRVPTPEEEDRRRVSRELKALTAERVRHVNRVKGLLFAQGVSGYEPLRRDRRAQLEQLQTGDGRPLPDHMTRQISRELDRLELLLEQIKAVAAERDVLLVSAAEDTVPAPAKLLLALKGVGPDFASVLWQEGLYRHFDNRRQVARMLGWHRRRGKVAPSTANRGFQVRKPQAANHHAATRLAVATTSAGFGTQPLVPPAGRHEWSHPQDNDHRFGPKAPRCTLEIRNRWCRHRGGDDENRLIDACNANPHLPGFDQSRQIRVGDRTPNLA
jgi:transposase